VLLGVVAFGIIAGVAMVASGIPPLAAMMMSILVFAGASMVASAQLLASGTPALLVILTTVFINLRFMMYSASLRLHFRHEPLGWRLVMAYLQADNVYGLTLMRFSDQPDAPGQRQYFLGAGLVVWAAWQLAVGAGILIGAGVPSAWRLEFAAPLAFIAMTIPLLRDRAMVTAAIVAGLTVIAAHALPFKLSIAAAAFAGIAAGMLFDRRWR
jgi:predicted branched-subunit amino acid permease